MQHPCSKKYLWSRQQEPVLQCFMYGGVCSELLCIAIALFWAAINAGGRVDSVLKDMAIAAFKSLSNCRSVQAIARQGCRKHGSKMTLQD
ncbi:hypothetical protein SUGI_1125690 [Cryptomeria japonica]|nr:hypothetical protein SUGI_1125670 [Cryptomeria japonica]GLJ52842.1 hypothetical protein SUGI_1125690 [Cryptomeria japonica]